MNLLKLNEEFQTEDACHAYLIALRWPEGVSCVYCKTLKVYRRKASHRFKCRSCNKSFSVTVGTIFHATKLPLRKWFLATTQILAAKKGISSLQLSRSINVDKDTAWYMQLRIRRAIKSDELVSKMVAKDEGKEFIAGLENQWKYFDYSRQKTNRSNKIMEEKTMFTSKRKKSELINVTRSPGYFPVLQRAVIGQYHRLSQRHLDGYIEEIVFKRVYRNVEGFDYLLSKACAFCWEMRETIEINQSKFSP